MHRQSFANHFVGQTSGSVTILFGLAVTVLAFVVGLAIDSARVYDIKARVQGALDAAALASAKLMDKDGITTAEIQIEAENYFQSQLKRLRPAGPDTEPIQGHSGLGHFHGRDACRRSHAFYFR